MAASILTFNGLDSDTDLGLIPTSLSGMNGSPAKTLGLLDIPALPGQIDSGVTASEAVRTLALGALVNAASVSALTTALDRIKEHLGTGLVEIKGPYSSTRAYYGALVGCDVEQFTPSALEWATVKLTFLCAQPYAIALTPDEISFGATRVAIPLGTAPSIGRDQWSAVIEIVGAATTPTLTYSNGSCDTVGTMVFTNSPSAGDSLVIDLGRRLVKTVTSGTFANGFTNLTAGYAWPALDPADGNVYGAVYPGLAVSSGTAHLRYFKHYR